MIRKLILILFLIPLAIVLIALTVANRGTVPLSLDVFNPGNPALTFNAPFFVWLYLAAGIGIVIGGIASWFAQGKHRKKEREYKKEAQKLRYEMEHAPENAAAPKSKSLALSN